MTIWTDATGIPPEAYAHPHIDQMGAGCRIADSVSFVRQRPDVCTARISLGEGVMLFDGVRLVLGADLHTSAFIRIGGGSVINVGSYLSGEGGLDIGEGVLVGPHAALLSAGHSLDAAEPCVARNPLTRAPVRIGAGAWIGARSIVLQGVRIGEGAVIGAGSVVTRDVPPMAVAVGNPARIMRFRHAQRGWRRLATWLGMGQVT